MICIWLRMMFHAACVLHNCVCVRMLCMIMYDCFLLCKMLYECWLLFIWLCMMLYECKCFAMLVYYLSIVFEWFWINLNCFCLVVYDCGWFGYDVCINLCDWKGFVYDWFIVCLWICMIVQLYMIVYALLVWVCIMCMSLYYVVRCFTICIWFCMISNMMYPA